MTPDGSDRAGWAGRLAAAAVCLLVGAGLGDAGASAAAPVPASHVAVDPPAGAPPGVCPDGASYGPPLPAANVSAARVRGGYSFLEGPVWIADPGYLLMSDLAPATGSQGVQPSTIRRMDPAGTVDTWVADSGSNGLALTPDGQQLVAATHDNRTVSTYRVADRSRAVLAADYQGRAFNSPNDVTVRADGVVYFTDPNFQRGRRPDAMGGRTGVFRSAGGQVSLVDDTVRQPNGIALSPDGRTLYVGAFAENRVYAYPVRPDGSTGTRTVFAAVNGPDGVTVDCAGNVYWVSHNEGRVHVFSPVGAALGTVSTGARATNAAFGGADRRTLYVTAGQQGDFGVYAVRLAVPGYPY
ncbi:gluconolactonase [Virgisporangium aliadipatigenens]|uniref:Gluconolactonase n=1 Tax=Virgisporangium aliadipatigenens TaxID=741659 RepID=A0A8J4DUK7_9ACTN|nr:SMP-30/gluconolactonase/LRE family protein [Virgisporangium aliadipatigenens]GIJ51415.1 gluconolactonase [Virgisporangium aliadipatigenens]